ncbi:MAG: RNA polymerase sporulation sigma factor SigK [Lachnospiraceae bacterium]|nr:RNA polymerase sporulation sigma factor SigK [Lachnospiraceae bacterium]
MKTFLSPLTLEEEKECIERMKEGDLKAKHQLIEHNLRLVAHVAKKYQASDEEMEDLISIGTIGLIKAVETFKIERQIKLATYAARCIDNELLMYFRGKKKTSKEVSLYEPIGTDKEGNQISLLDIAAGEEIDVVQKMEESENIQRLYGYIPEVLSAREQSVIVMRYGILGNEIHTQREVAKKLNISRSYVSRIEKKALARLRRRFEMEKVEKI